MAAAVTNVTTGDIRAQTVNIGGMNVPRSWLFGLSALIFSAFTYFGLIQPALFPPRLEISDSVIDGYLMSKGIPVTSAEAEALKEMANSMNHGK